MDPVNLVFYAAVCGTLAAVAPQGKSRVIRGVFGIVVGLFAAGILPFLKGLLGL